MRKECEARGLWMTFVWRSVDLDASLVTVAQYNNVLPRQDAWTPNVFGGHLIARKTIEKDLGKALLGLTSKCLICPSISGTESRLSRISREFYQKETINVPVNKQTYLLYSRGCHKPGSINSRESVGNLDNLSVKIAQAGQSPSTSIISAYSS